MNNDAAKALLILRAQPHPSMLRIQQDALIAEFERMQRRIEELERHCEDVEEAAMQVESGGSFVGTPELFDSYLAWLET